MEVGEFYSDSLSDTPMAEIAGRAFIVKRGELQAVAGPRAAEPRRRTDLAAQGRKKYRPPDWEGGLLCLG